MDHHVGDIVDAHFVWQEYMFDAPQKLSVPRLHNLLEDPRERHNVAPMNTWVYHPVFKIISDFEASLKREPPIPPGALDPWEPKRGR